MTSGQSSLTVLSGHVVCRPRVLSAMWGVMKIRNSIPTLGPSAKRPYILIVRGIVAMLLFAVVLMAESARADFRLCNNTGNRVGIAVGYKENEGWTTEGWWNVPARSCETVLRGSLVARFYYIYAVDYDRGGEWSGQAFMCTREKEFTIRGTDDCLARGYDRTGFFEVDTGDQPSWTVKLNESADQVPMKALQSRVPLMRTPAGA